MTTIYDYDYTPANENISVSSLQCVDYLCKPYNQEKYICEAGIFFFEVALFEKVRLLLVNGVLSNYRLYSFTPNLSEAQIKEMIVAQKNEIKQRAEMEIMKHYHNSISLLEKKLQEI